MFWRIISILTVWGYPERVKEKVSGTLSVRQKGS